METYVIHLRQAKVEHVQGMFRIRIKSEILLVGIVNVVIVHQQLILLLFLLHGCKHAI